ncbi:MAG: PmoA family protein, partial [Saprospiraceae bacterium]|nr:PmoA family protein [Saprospiraceae bacterium]
MKSFVLIFTAFWLLNSCSNSKEPSSTRHTDYHLQVADGGDQVSILGSGGQIVLTQNAGMHHRPYLHPLVSPDLKSIMTEYSPGHHRHQTGIYWGMTRVNQRDFFHNPGEGYWRRLDLTILQDTGTVLRWSTKYEMLDSISEVLLTETQIWSFQSKAGRYLLDLEWQGQAAQDVTIGEYDYGGLFVRMPWTENTPSEVVNAARDRDQRAEGKRAMWIDLGMQLEGREDMARISMYDHPQNGGYPTPWRVDGQFGVGPARCRLGDWEIPRGHTEIMKYRLEVYTGNATDIEITDRWEDYAGE